MMDPKPYHLLVFLLLYILMLTSFMRPQMNISISVDSYFFSAKYVVLLGVTFRFDLFMVVAALPITVLTVIALTKWNEATDHPTASRSFVSFVVFLYVALLIANFAGNGLVMQNTLARFQQPPLAAWRMYGDLLIAFGEFLLTSIQSIATRQSIQIPELVYVLH
ncbi:uncharacterized protein LOC117896855 [Drosophila subobscura]|uniref:uncharacterized protein LOC117896855 n=1 Tax=Drosophila subobscura TaxID=7241 RepID=UPI00155A1396|nr:uncharacterized protein LOC117896855 [Drosophila subobscura]